MDEQTNNLMNFSDFMAQDENLRPLLDVIEQIMSMSDASLTDEVSDMMAGMFDGAFTPKVRENAITQIIEGFNDENYNRAAANQVVENLRAELNKLVDDLGPSAHKRKLLNKVTGMIMGLFDEAIERFHAYDIVLPFKIENGGKIPTYAHEDDACADIYSSENVTVKAHSFSNMIHTGMRMALPEGWVAKIVPRSSIGAKTPLRLSNSIGVIDSGYRGEVMVLYDNLSDSDYEIKAGDRIAQMWVEPVKRFKGVEVDLLGESDRGEGGFGSSGK